MSNIASLATMSDSLDTTAKFIRVLEKEGVAFEQLMRPMNSRAARRNLAAFLRAGCPEVDAKARAVEKRRLYRLGHVALPERAEPFNPAVYFQTRANLFVWSDFHDRILAAAKPLDAAPAATLVSFKLAKASNDEEIRKELPDGHLFENAGAFCAHLAALIERQPSGEEGDLLANGYANIFYVIGVNSEVFAVCVYWYGAYRRWRAYAHRLDDSRWSDGFRAFSSNC